MWRAPGTSGRVAVAERYACGVLSVHGSGAVLVPPVLLGHGVLQVCTRAAGTRRERVVFMGGCGRNAGLND